MAPCHLHSQLPSRPPSSPSVVPPHHQTLSGRWSCIRWPMSCHLVRSREQSQPVWLLHPNSWIRQAETFHRKATHVVTTFHWTGGAEGATLFHFYRRRTGPLTWKPILRHWALSVALHCAIDRQMLFEGIELLCAWRQILYVSSHTSAVIFGAYCAVFQCQVNILDYMKYICVLWNYSTPSDPN